MKVPETGKVCGNVLRAIDEFQNKYIINFDDVKCPCENVKALEMVNFLIRNRTPKLMKKLGNMNIQVFIEV